MQNWIWFLLLTVLSFILFLYTYYKTKNPLVVLFWLFISGLGYLFELIIFVVFDSYSYYPDVFSDDFNDSVLGSISSQAFSIPIVITFMAVQQKKNNFKWKLFMIVTFFLIEELFLLLGLYEQHWWRSWFTSITLFTAIPMARKWYNTLQIEKNDRSYFLTLLFAIYTCYPLLDGYCLLFSI